MVGIGLLDCLGERGIGKEGQSCFVLLFLCEFGLCKGNRKKTLASLTFSFQEEDCLVGFVGVWYSLDIEL